ncbi:MAG: serine/threonine-protein kinase, partial [Myxococcota bacterium]
MVPTSEPSPFSEQDVEADDDLVGVVLGGTFEIVRVIADGGTGRVYEAHHRRIGSKRFAVKVLHAAFLRHAEAWGRFQREAEAAGSIHHPHVVDVYDVDRTPDGRPYLAYQYLEGVDLGALVEEVEQGPLPPHIAAQVGVQICAGLAAAHAKGVIHRDVKPQNIMLVGEATDEPNAKVLDFGLSRIEDEKTNTLTKTGALLGTPAYMSPEQARGEQVSPLTDVYGVGTVLYFLLTAHPPFERDNLQQTLIAVMGEEPVRPRHHQAAISTGLEMVVQRAMAKEPKDRFQSMEEMAEALLPHTESARTQPSVRPPAITLSDAQPPLASRRLLVFYLVVWSILAMTAVATLLVGVIHATGGDASVSNRELVLILLALTGTAFTPGFLWLRRLRGLIWNNSIRVQKLQQELRGDILSALFGYGVAALLVRLFDTVLARFTEASLFGSAGGPGWMPLNVVYLAVAAVAVV